MADTSQHEEDLRRIAGEAHALAGRLCQGCADMHALWPYIRLARASTGIEDQGSRLEMELSKLIRGGRREVLIAGAQDTGLLALVTRASRDANVMVLDRCGTPLELCRRLAQGWSLQIVTMHADLRDLDIAGRFDIVLVHFTLHYIGAEERLDVLMRLRRALVSGGRLLLLFNISRNITGPLALQGRDGYAGWVLDELQRIAVALPEPTDAFRARLRRHGERREGREGVFAGPEAVTTLLEKAGFELCECVETNAEVSDAVRDFVARIDKRRFLAIAAPLAGP